ncbi:MAG: hypothetical protein EOM12_13695 [Verrucomicrobiae bacterium]|nr:hypothetical protein [Verrucomicrobiae bacterium]
MISGLGGRLIGLSRILIALFWSFMSGLTKTHSVESENGLDHPVAEITSTSRSDSTIIAVAL